jgi:hypothetical protein
MAQPDQNSEIADNSSETSLGRRELLKALAAGSGVIAASTMIPGQWVKPVIEAGLLPVHAQASPTPTVTPIPTVTPTPTATLPPPIVYSLSCTANPTSGNTTFVVDITVTVSATGGASVNNIEVQFIAETVSPGQATSPVTGFTDGSGVVNLGNFELCPSTLPSQGGYQIVVSFVDQATYGTDTCVLGPYASLGC